HEMSFFDKKDIDGVLYELLRSPWLQALLKVYECLHQYIKRRPVSFISQAQELMHEVVELLHRGQQSPEIKELRQLLQGPHFKALLLAHDTVAQKDFEPMLPPLTENLAENEEAMRIVCLGATIKRHELTGDIIVARVIHGGLLYAGDKLVEVNGIPVEGLEPEQVIHILALSQSTIMFKLIPGSDRIISNQTTLYVRAMWDYCPRQDPLIPCVDAGLLFKKGEILQIVDQKDILWWQARKVSNLKAYDMQIDEKCVETEEEEFIGSGQPVFITGFRRSMRLCRRKCNYSHLACHVRCLNSCYGAMAAPYEEVVRYQRQPGDRNRLIVLIGPSGVGVNELRRQLIGINPHLFRNAVPHTTRAQKSYEENGREYHYVPKETFENMVYNYRMLEYGEYKGHLYGTSIDAVHAVLNEGKICIVDLEPYSIQFVRTHDLKPYIIFIKPPSVSCMKQTRKNARIITDYYVNMKFKEEDLQEMEESAKKMETQFGQFFDQLIVNDNLQEACLQLVSAVHQAQNEPQWVPATWICPGSQD
ncbi:hypothetical protein E2320_020055, partial [Naja naja]